jgi:ribosomal protein S12 methylthiotransferase accessory factor
MYSQTLVDTFMRMVDPRLGIVKRIAPIPLQPGEPPLFVLAANCTRPKYFIRNAPFPDSIADYAVPANGVAFSAEQALWRVLGEACERYTAGIYSEDSFVTASRRELGSDALPVENLIGFSARQYARDNFPFVPFDPDARIRWTQGSCLTRSQPVWIPAALVYLGYEIISPAELFYPCLSTGLAAGRTLEQALLAGLCENVERDAFMATWLLRRPPPRVSLGQLEKLLDARELALIHNEDFDCCVTLSSTDIAVPTAITVIRPRGQAKAVVGSGAHPCLRTAISRSLLEAYHTLNWSIVLERDPKSIEVQDVSGFEDHVRYYLDPQHFDDIAWLAQGPEIDALEQHVESTSYEVYFVETTTADVQSLGFRTVRVIVPGLHPLNVGYDTVHEDRRRLERVAAHWGIEMPNELNSQPHPFP